MVKHIICSNQVELIYENIDHALFNGIEVWLDFGSCQDPLGYNGIAHLLEHLIVFSGLKELDLYALKKGSGKTSKERIRIYTSVSVKKTETVLQQLLNNIVNLNPPEYIFEFQKCKVRNEVTNIKKSVLLQYLAAAEEKTLFGTGYEKPVEGTAYDVSNIELEYVKKYLNQKLEKCRIIISIAGNANVCNLKEIIKSNIKRERIYIEPNNVRLDNIIFNVNKILLETAVSNGKLLMIGSYPDCFDTLFNMVCSRVFGEYLKYFLKDSPVMIKTIDYKSYHLLTVFIADMECKLKYTEEKICCFLRDINNKLFILIKNYVYEEYQSIIGNSIKLSFYNVEQCFFNQNINLSELLLYIEKISFDDFRQYAQCVLKKNNMNSVVSQNIAER